MRITILYPDRPPEDRDIDRDDFVSLAKSLIPGLHDVTSVVYNGRPRMMVVGDECGNKSPLNKLATEAYLASCKPGTQWSLGGIAIVFDGMHRE